MTSDLQLKAAKTVSTDSIYAWKMANVYVTHLHAGIMRFRPVIIANPTYGVDDVARCALRKAHRQPPYDGCRCGFNAWHDIDVARTYMQAVLDRHCMCFGGKPKWVSCAGLLRVRLEGGVIEGTLDAENLDKWGYRASRQRVTDVFFADTCDFCSKDAVGLSINGKTTTLPNVAGGVLFLPLRPSCANCSTDVLSPAKLMEINDVGIHLGYPSE